MSRAERVTVPARTGASPGPTKRVLSFSAPELASRVVEIGSPEGKPFQAIVTWSAAGSDTGKAHVVVATGTRISLVAKEIQVDARNLHTVDSEVVCLVGDGVAVTRNFWEEEFEAPVTLESVRIPPHALTVRLDPSDGAASGNIRLLNGRGNLLVKRDWNDILPGGLPLGGASLLLVTCTHPSRVAFELSL